MCQSSGRSRVIRSDMKDSGRVKRGGNATGKASCRHGLSSFAGGGRYPLGTPFFPVEPVVRQPRLVLISLFACVPWCMPVSAITFQTRMERAEWKVEGDQFECRLTQPVADFGSGEFVRRAGEQATFRLKVRERWLGPGSAT